MNKTLNKKQNLIIQHAVFAACFILSLFFLLWKAPFGLGGDDEAFYLTIPLRLLQGDAFLVDEYHLSQLSGFLLYPLVWLYKLFVPSLDGIILAFRYIYVIFHSVTTIVIYARIKSHGLFAASAALILYLYAPYNIMACSYNTMGLDLVALTGVLLAASSLDKSRFTYILSGLTFAGAVLCNPYLAFVFAFFAIGVLIYYIIKKDKRVFKAMWLFVLGVSILAAAFLIFLLSRASVSEIITALPSLFNDPDHPSISAVDKLFYYFSSTLSFVPSMSVIVPLYCVSLILLILDKNRDKRRSLHFLIPAVLALAYLLDCLPSAAANSYNFIMYPLVFCGMTAFLLTKKKNIPVFLFVYLLGFAYSVCMCFSSNQYFYVISMASTVSNIGSVILMAELYKEIKADNSQPIMFTVTCMVLIICQLGIMCYSKANHMFWERHTPSQMTAEYSLGPLKGIRRHPDDAAVYNTLLYNDIKPLKEKSGGNVLYMSHKTWYYLATPELNFGTFSAWLSGETPEAAERLVDYYKLNPSHIPDYIYIPADAKWQNEDIEKILSCGEYTKTKTNFGCIYEKVK